MNGKLLDLKDKAIQHLDGLVTFREFIGEIIHICGEEYLHSKPDGVGLTWSEQDQLILAQSIASMGRKEP